MVAVLIGNKAIFPSMNKSSADWTKDDLEQSLPGQEAFHVQHSLSLSTHRRTSRKWSVARIEASLSGAPRCPGGSAAHSQSRSRDHLPRRHMDETGSIKPSGIQRGRACGKTMGSSFVSQCKLR